MFMYNATLPYIHFSIENILQYLALKVEIYKMHAHKGNNTKQKRNYKSTNSRYLYTFLHILGKTP